MKRFISIQLTVVCFLTQYAFGIAQGKASIDRPNIVIITTDQQTADAISFFMGSKWINTPNLDKLAAEGVVFSRAYSANPLCVPSRNSIITGLYPHTTGIESNGDLANWKNSTNNFWGKAGPKSLGVYFRNAGYETAYFGKWHLNYKPEDHLINGFETVKLFRKPENDSLIPNSVDEFLNKAHEKPVLIWASFINPHDICQWARFQKLPLGPIEKVPPVSQWPPIKHNLAPPKNETEAMALIRESYHRNRRLFPVGDYSQFDWRRLRWGYYRLIEKVDMQIGKLLDVVIEHGYDKNTLVVFTSDHGTSLGAHEFVQKTVFYEESVNIPFILKFKGKLTPDINESLVNNGIDILPTILDFAHIKIPEYLPGISLKTAAKSGDVLKRLYIVSENRMEQGDSVNGRIPVVNGRMVRSRRYKYCIYDTLEHREALFDLKKDPGETVNIANEASSHAILVRHRKYLKEFAIENGDKCALQMLENLEYE